MSSLDVVLRRIDRRVALLAGSALLLGACSGAGPEPVAAEPTGTAQAASTAATGKLVFYGGQVITRPKIVMVYVGNWDQSPKSLNAQATIERFYSHIAGTPYFQTLSGYHDAAGTHVDSLMPIPILDRIFDTDMSNPATNDAMDKATIASRQAHDDGQTIYINVPYAGIAPPCGDGNTGCRGLFGLTGKYGSTQMRDGGPWITAFDGNGNFDIGLSATWFHELVETMLDGDGSGWRVQETAPISKLWDIADVCDYGDSPWYIDNIPMRTTVENDAFRVNGFVVPELNSDAMHACSHTFLPRAELYALGNYPYHLWNASVSAPESSISFTSWYDVGTIGASATLAGGPGAAAWGPSAAYSPSRVDLFNLDWSGQIQHGWWIDGLPHRGSIGTAPMGWTFHAEPAIVTSGPGNMSILMTGTLNGSSLSGLWQRTFEQGGDSGWTYRGNPGSVALSGVGAVAFADGTVDAFVTGADNAIYRAHIDPSSGAPRSTTWGMWNAPYSGRTWPVGNRPSATSWEPGYVQMALNDGEGRLWLCSGTTTGHCSTYGQPAAGVTNSPTITHLGDRRMLVAVRGGDAQEYLRLWDHDGFGPWVPAGGNMAGGSPAIVGY